MREQSKPTVGPWVKEQALGRDPMDKKHVGDFAGCVDLQIRNWNLDTQQVRGRDSGGGFDATLREMEEVEFLFAEGAGGFGEDY